MTSRAVPEGTGTGPDSAGLAVRRETDGDHGDVREVHALAFGDCERVPAPVEALRARGET